MADVYDLAPMCRATTRLLASFMGQAFPPNNEGKVFHFLEVGGGTGKISAFKFHVHGLTASSNQVERPSSWSITSLVGESLSLTPSLTFHPLSPAS